MTERLLDEDSRITPAGRDVVEDFIGLKGKAGKRKTVKKNSPEQKKEKPHKVDGYQLDI